MNGVTNTNPKTITSTGYANFSNDSLSVKQLGINTISRVSSDESLKIDDNSTGKYSVFDIANWFLLKDKMTHKKLQNLCYYAQAWYYALHNKRLEDTDFQAWVHGPVSPFLYERFKVFGMDTIQIKGKYVFMIDPDDEVFLNNVWDTYGDNSGNSLEMLTHRELPLIEARNGYKPNEKCTVVISPTTMATYYKSIYTGGI